MRQRIIWVCLLVGCGDLSEEALRGAGSVRIDIPLSNQDITGAAYVVRGDGMAEPLEGVLPVVQGSIGGTIANIPGGSDRTLSVHAYIDEEIVCLGETQFDVFRGQTIEVTLPLSCSGVTGSIHVRSTFQTTAALDAGRVVVAGEDMPVPIVVPLTIAAGAATCDVRAVPVGLRRVQVELLADGDIVCEGAWETTVAADKASELDDLILTCAAGTGAIAVVAEVNFAPQIHGVGASAAEVTAGEGIDVWVVASDPDDAALRYAWQGSDGTLSQPEASQSQWFAELGQVAGTVILSVSVSDGRGGVATAELPVRVVDAPLPVVINEILVDGVANDAQEVFVELFGVPGTPLGQLALVGVNGNDGEVYRTLPLSGEIGADGFFVIAHPDATANASLQEQVDLVANVDFQNGPDAVRLVQAGRQRDAIGYGYGGEAPAASSPPVGQSLARRIDGSDSDDNAADFCVATPTPGAENRCAATAN